MAKKRPITEKYWDAQITNQVKAEYAEFLRDKGKKNDPDAADLFATEKIGSGFDYMGIKKRDLILLLAGTLPYMYD